MVNEKMLDAHRRAFADKSRDPNAGTRHVMESAIQAAIDEAWTTFDPKDKATWPAEDVGYLVKCGEAPHGYEVCWFSDGTLYHVGIEVLDPVEYCRVSDLTPTHEDETP